MQSDFYKDLFAPFGYITTRKMFGTDGFYCDGLFFAIVADGELWLKADDTTRATFEEAGAEQYVYRMQKKPAPLPYYRAPEDIFDEDDSLRFWTQMALEAASRSRK
ncbi:MAG: TfoX/Sxy family protein [Pseudomonadota bacterium]